MVAKKAKYGTEIDLTSGNIFVKMLLFSLPVIFTSILELLFTSSNLFIVANFSNDGMGSVYMASIASNGSLINLLVNTFAEFSVGANVIVSRFKGANDRYRATKAATNSLLLAFSLGIMVGITGFFCSRYILVLMKTKAEYIDGAEAYLSIYFLGCPFLLTYNFGASILRALGDSRRPLYALMLCLLINVCLSFMFVMGFGMKVRGVGYAVVISEFMEMVCVVYFIVKKKGNFLQVHKDSWLVDWNELGPVLKNGFPAGLESFIFALTNVAIQMSANEWCDASAIAGSTASDTIEGYIFASLQAFAIATSSVSSQNLAAKNKKNLKLCLRFSVGMIIGLGLVLGLLAVLLREQLIGLFISSNANDEIDLDEAMSQGERRLMMMGSLYFMCSVMDACSGYLRGLGHWLLPTVITLLAACVLRLVYVFAIVPYVPALQNVLMIYLAYPLAWSTADLIYLFIIPIIQKKTMRQIDEEKRTMPQIKRAC